MKKFLKLDIHTPCHEKWEEMTENELGRFCQSCQKTVVDFTQLTNLEVSIFLKHHQGELCGRFMPEQLEQPYVLLEAEKSSPVMRYVAALLAGFMTLPTANYAQSSNNTEQSTQSIPLTETKNDSKPSHSPHKISGRLVFEDGRPAAFVNVGLIGPGSDDFSRYTETDADGYFAFWVTWEAGGCEIEVELQDKRVFDSEGKVLPDHSKDIYLNPRETYFDYNQESIHKTWVVSQLIEKPRKSGQMFGAVHISVFRREGEARVESQKKRTARENAEMEAKLASQAEKLIKEK